MDAKHLIGGAFFGQLLIAASLALSGCASSTTGGALAAPPPAATTRADGAAGQAVEDPNAPTPDALARKTAGYVQEMQAALDRQNRVNSGSGPADVNDQDGPTGAIVPNKPPGPEAAGSTNPRSTAQTPSPAPTEQQSQVEWEQPTQAPAGSGVVVEPAPAPRVTPAPQPAASVAPRPKPPTTVSPTATPAPAAPSVVPVAPSPAQPAAKPVIFPQVLPESVDLPGGSSGGGIGLQSADDLERKLAQKIKDDPRDIPAQLDYQLLEFVKGRATPDMSAVAGLPAEDREIVTSILDGLGNFQSQVTADSNLLLVRKIQPLLEMADRLRSESDLSISTIQLCTKVDGYGMYKLADTHYKSGQENPVIVYTEISNFTSELNESHQWETKLTQQAILYTETGIPVWPEKPTAQSVVDQCRNRRHDFFVANVVRLPATLQPGRYLLKVTITDQLADRVAEATTPLEIQAP
jgi:hypothetical protein